MEKSLKILILENSAADAEMVQRLLKKEKIDFECRVAMNEKTYLLALDEFQPDLIMADNSLPQFSAAAALKIIKQRSLQIPFLMVTSTTSEEFAAGIIKLGADDYILKDSLIRLPAAIDSALKQRRSEKEKLEAFEKLRQSEEQYRQIVETAQEGIWMIDENSLTTFVNEHMAKMLGYEKKEMINRHLFDFMDEEGKKIAAQNLEKRKKGISEQHDFVFRSKTGKAVWTIIETNSIIKNEKYSGALAMVIDITERKQTEQQLLQDKKLLRTLIDNLPDYIYVKNIELAHIINNASNVKLIGAASEEETLGKTAFDYFEPELAQQYIKDDRIILESKKPLLNKEEPIINNKGEERWLLTTKIPLQDKDDNVIGLIGISRDITDQKNAEQQIINEKELSDSLINNLPGIFYLYDKQGNFLRWNKNFETVTGYSDDEIKNMRPVDFYDTDLKELINKRIESVFKEKVPGIEAMLLTKEKKKIPFYFNSMRIWYEGKHCLIGMGIDISVQKNAEAEIRQLASHLQEIREEERAGIAREIHDELGQQITGLKMDISWISKKLITEDKNIKEKINKVLELLDDTVKTVRKIATDLRPSILDDLGIIEAMKWQSQEFQKRSGIKVEFFSDDFTEALTNKINIGLFRIYQESLTNVARHAEGASLVTSELYLKNNRIELTIKDNGKGFDINSISNKKTLGLLGMKERTLMMGGEYNIISHSGEGTRVTVSVPLQTNQV
jgi:PAS domain S-box-containing protein